ncbi:parallel beta-helix repeat protein [Actinomadura pelletieri DSM 43383]|uniref:Parallel beta-helix repeat protein n=1 Tax=Actinomadura pelletieri DSM 43383 TaxID=1120940 RepID=A0A495QHJ4_9ACTN|nr:NosD domain-containing protein [Actinomadura pelletieri]RKS71211.1 parallel beta-helix repeat protein [Actinomadura pelletieri DSM 43383]
MRKMLVSTTVVAMAGGILIGVPAAAEAAAYACQGADKGVYNLCVYNQSGKTIKGKTFSKGQNGILIRNSSNITISGNVFKNLKGSKGYAGVHVKESTGITIKGNTFTKLSNVGHMHGVYMYRTTNSRITGNKFSYITGDAVRLRDRSSNNTVDKNTITRSGKFGAISEWGQLAPIGSEKCGTGNVFKNNKYGNSYANKKLAMIKWGGKGGGKAGPLTWNNCKKASIKNGGGNKKI